MSHPLQQLLKHSDFIDIDGAQVWLVGGAVRDAFLGRTSVDNDWLVTGATSERMSSAGFKQVGQDFPVFLHPHTQEEYALARTERKSGHGYHGFDFSFCADTPIEEDLARRDLTINAMALNVQGELVDPYAGREDLKARILRHVSPAFIEDPLRVLRVARFAAQLHGWGFVLAPETQALMRSVVESGELAYLQAERVWQETARALCCDHPHVYIRTLYDCGALAQIFPELDALFGVPQSARYHPEIDTGVHTLMVMEQSAGLSPKLEVRFAAMTHDLGKGTTPESEWPRHIGHEMRSYQLLQKVYQRLPVPKQCQIVADKVAQYHLHAHRAFELRAQTVQRLLKSLDSYRKPEVFEDYLLSCLADSRGRTGFETAPYPQIDYLRECYQQTAPINAKQVCAAVPADEQPRGRALGEAIDAARCQQIQLIKKRWSEKLQSAEESS